MEEDVEPENCIYLTLFSDQCHNCTEKPLKIMQKDALKLFEGWISFYIYLGNTSKKLKSQKQVYVGPENDI